MSELIDALNQLQKEKNIEKEVIMQAIEDSLVAACNRDFGKNAIVKVNMDRETGAISVFVEKTVVEEVEDPAVEISLEDAKMRDFHYELGDCESGSYAEKLWTYRCTACQKRNCAENQRRRAPRAVPAFCPQRKRYCYRCGTAIQWKKYLYQSG